MMHVTSQRAPIGGHGSGPVDHAVASGAEVSFGEQYAALTAAQAPGADAAEDALSTTHLEMPTEESVGRLLKQAQAVLRRKMQAAGLPEDPPFTLHEDLATGRFSVEGDRADKAQIEDLINSDAKLRLGLHNVSALASQIPYAKAAAQYATDWANATSDAQRTAVFRYYRALFDSLHSETRLSVGAGGLALTLNGEAIAPAA